MKQAFAMTLLILGMTCAAVAAQAACPSSPPVSIKTQSGDQKVNAAWLKKNLGSRTLVFDYGGKSTYRPDGSFRYADSSGTYDAPTYRFYDDGTQCTGYPNRPRFDRFVVRDEKLVLINASGKRFEVKITK